MRLMRNVVDSSFLSSGSVLIFGQMLGKHTHKNIQNTHTHTHTHTHTITHTTTSIRICTHKNTHSQNPPHRYKYPYVEKLPGGRRKGAVIE